MRMVAVLDAKAIAQMGSRRYLRTLSGRANYLYPVWDSVLNVLYEAEQQLFAQEGQTDEHSRWAELSPRYAAWKEEHYPGMPILTLTGRFRGSMTDPAGQHTEIRERRRLTWGSDHKVSGGHDLGGILAATAREPIRITQRNVDDIADVIVDHILDFDLSRPRQDWELGY